MDTATSDLTKFGIRIGAAREGGDGTTGALPAGWHSGTWGMLQAGAPLRVAHWPGRANGPGTIVLVHGRAEFIEVYEETIGWLLDRGFAVIAFDFRGQGGSKRRTRGTGHVFTFREYVDDLAAVVRHAGEIGLPRPFHILAHSMGGLVALLAAESLKREVERMVLLAPLLGIERLPLPLPFVGLVSGFARLAGLSRLAATKMEVGGQPFEGNRVTSDPERYARLGDLVDRNPHLTTGAPTLGWLSAALGAVRSVRRMEGQSLPIPTLFVASGGDTIVSTPAIDRFARSVTGGGLVTVPHARHQVLIERDEMRTAALAAIAVFLVDAPRRLSRVPARSGRPLRFTPAATVEARPPSEPPAAGAAAIVSSAAEPAAARPDIRADRVRSRLRRRGDRSAGRTTGAPAPLDRREPTLDAPSSDAPRVGSGPSPISGAAAELAAAAEAIAHASSDVGTAWTSEGAEAGGAKPEESQSSAQGSARDAAPPASPQEGVDRAIVESASAPLFPAVNTREFAAAASNPVPTEPRPAPEMKARDWSRPADDRTIRYAPEPRRHAADPLRADQAPEPGVAAKARSETTAEGEGAGTATVGQHPAELNGHASAHTVVETVADTDPVWRMVASPVPPPAGAASNAAESSEGAMPVNWIAARSSAPPLSPEGPRADAGAAEVSEPVRVVDRIRRIPPPTPRPVRGKGGRKR